MFAISLVIESDNMYVHKLLFAPDEAAAFKAIRDLAEEHVKDEIFIEEEWDELVEEYPTDKELVEFLKQSLDGDVMLDYIMEPISK